MKETSVKYIQGGNIAALLYEGFGAGLLNLELRIHTLIDDGVDSPITDDVIAARSCDAVRVIAGGQGYGWRPIPLIAEVVDEQAAGTPTTFWAKFDPRKVFLAGDHAVPDKAFEDVGDAYRAREDVTLTARR